MEVFGGFSACLILRTIQLDVKPFETRDEPNPKEQQNTPSCQAWGVFEESRF
jgi:hypothetical protein